MVGPTPTARRLRGLRRDPGRARPGAAFRCATARWPHLLIHGDAASRSVSHHSVEADDAILACVQEPLLLDPELFHDEGQVLPVPDHSVESSVGPLLGRRIELNLGVAHAQRRSMSPVLKASMAVRASWSTFSPDIAHAVSLTGVAGFHAASRPKQPKEVQQNPASPIVRESA